MLIDDEADNASINTKKDKDTDPTAINDNIRKIIQLFNRSAYVGYTATPFANIFIAQDETDLFPRDFIINLPAPDNYIGPNKVLAHLLKLLKKRMMYCLLSFLLMIIRLLYLMDIKG